MEPQSIKGRIFQDLVKRGVPAMVAAGWAGNWDVETGGFKQMQEQNPISGQGGLGWGQWTGPRRQEFLDFSKQSKLDPNSYEANFGNALREMEQGVHMPKGFNDYVARTAKSPSEAALLISQNAQRPAKGMEHNPERMASAEDVFKTFNTSERVNTTEGTRNPQLLRANVDPSRYQRAQAQQPQQPHSRPALGDATGFISAGYGGVSNPGYEDVSNQAEERMKGLISLLLAGGLGGQRSRMRK